MPRTFVDCIPSGQKRTFMKFQIGRCNSAAIDFTIGNQAIPQEPTELAEAGDTPIALPGSRNIHSLRNPYTRKTRKGSNFTQSTISRYACRIDIERGEPYTARIYAAGFDQQNNIFLGVSSPLFHYIMSSVNTEMSLKPRFSLGTWGL